MTTIAELGIKVESQSADEAADNLDRLAASGANAEGAVNKLGSTADAANRKWHGMATAADVAAMSIGKGTASITKQKEALNRLISEIDPATAALDRLDKQQRALQSFKKLGLLDTQSFDEYNRSIEQSRKQLGSLQTAQTGVGKTSKEMSFALRGLPAQFTDIAVSLQAGQAPLTVFLQQGGQLKDMFGGVGPAVRAIGGYVAGLITPFTVAAAAAGTLAIAYRQVEQEQQAFNISLLSTGNLFGQTSASLGQLAGEVSETAGTTGKAADVLAQIAGSGKIVSGAMKEATIAAIEWEKATGQAIDTTIKEFAKLGTDPAENITKLNEQYNFLTDSIYAQIVALEEQGRKEEAAELAQNTFSAALTERANKAKEDLDGLTLAWRYVADGAKEAWDSMLNVFRDDAEIERLQQRIADVQGGGEIGFFQDRDLLLSDLREELDMMVSKREAEKDIAEFEAEQQKAENKRISAREAWNIREKQNLTDKQRLAKEINKIEAQGILLGKSRAEIEAQIANASSKINGKGKTVGRVSADAGDTRLSAVRQETAALAEQLGVTEKLTAGERALVKFNQEIADLKERTVLTVQQKQIVASESEIRAELAKRVELEQQLKLREESVKLSSYQATLDAQLRQTAQGFELSLAGAGMGDEASKRAQEILKVGQEYQRQSQQLQTQFNQGQISEQLYTSETAALESALRERLEMQKKYYEEVDRQQQDWVSGAKTAYANYVESAKDVSKQTENLFTSAFRGMEDAIVEFAITGKLSFSDLAKSILSDIARIATQRAIAGVAESFAGGSGGSGGWGAAIGSIFSSAAGRASGGPVAPSSLYEVNERGPELLNQNGRQYLMTGQNGGSITPLNNASNLGGSGGSMGSPNITVIINRDDTATVEDDSEMGSGIGENILTLVRGEIAKNERNTLAPGGGTWRLVNGR